MIDLEEREIRILETPKEFKEELYQRILRANECIYLNCLYISRNEYKEILDLIRGKNVQVFIGLDYYRGNRDPIINNQAVNAYFFKSPNHQRLSKMLPERWNEALGTFHVKGFMIDSDMILSGANLSRDYFTNRQDR